MLALFAAMLAVFSYESYSQPPRRERNRAERLIDEGDRSFAAQDYQSAVGKYAQAVSIWESNSSAHFKKGQAHFFLGEYALAVSELDLALRHEHRPIDVWRVRWEALDKLKRYDEALADVNNILAADPDNIRYQLAAANLYFNKGAYREAADTFAKAAPKAANSADVYYRLAEALSKLGDIEGQAAAAEEAIKRNTQFLADALLLLGRARYAQKRIPEAIDAFSRALASRPDKLESYRLLAELYRSQNEIEKGLKTLEEGRSLNATNGEVYKDLALFYSLAEKNEEAITAGKSATQLLPNDPVAYLYLCRAYYQARKPELAISACNSVLRLGPENGEALFYLARTTRAVNRPAEAEKYLKRALTSLQAYTKDHPEDADGFYLLGNVYADLLQNANAVTAYQRTLELNARLTKANFNIGVIRFNEKDKPAAMEQYNLLLISDKDLAEKLKALIDTM